MLYSKRNFWRQCAIFIILAGGGVLVSSALTHARTYFADVDTTHPNFYAIEWLREEGIVQGYRANFDQQVFRPLGLINRAESVKVLMSYLGIDPSEDQVWESPFPDVPVEAWFAPHIQRAKTLQIVKGFHDGNFHPSAFVSQAEFLKMLVTSLELPLGSASEEEQWFAPYVQAVEHLRLVDKPIANPHSLITRGQVAELIFRADQVVQNDMQPYVFWGWGKASYYAKNFHGRRTASGEIYDSTALTAAHRTLPFGTKIKVWLEGDETNFVVVTINDRGPYHNDRVIDLSKASFAKLAPISRGVLPVWFKLVVHPNDTGLPIPEQIRPSLTQESLNPAVPTTVLPHLQTVDTKELDTSTVESTELPVPLFVQGKTSLSREFFADVVLREPFPQKILIGSVFNIAGTTIESGHEKVTVFLENIDTKEQQAFTAPISGKNFVVPIAFLQAGEFLLGMVVDKKTRSRVENITVLNQDDARPMDRYLNHLEGQTELSLQPEKSLVNIKITKQHPTNSVVRVRFFQPQGSSQQLFFPANIDSYDLPYDFFTAFDSAQQIYQEVAIAPSLDGSLDQRSHQWQHQSVQQWSMVPGFSDHEDDKMIQVKGYQRFHKTATPQSLTITSERGLGHLGDHIYVTEPSGKVMEIPLQKNHITQIATADFVPKHTGGYVLEVISNQGAILFNRGFYIYSGWVLPVLDWPRTNFFSTSIPGIWRWVNTLRTNHNRSALRRNDTLDEIAQSYAEHMASLHFLSHISPGGETLGDRIANQGLSGNVGENLGYGTTLRLVLQGLENSGSHRHNALHPEWKSVGIGMARDDAGGFYVVQLFGD